ncbi:MAG: molybdopterin cofactor-binding domain-containing protein [Pseudomonadota bacterium]
MTPYFDLSRRRFLRTTVVGGAAVLSIPLLGRQAGIPGAIAQEVATTSDAALFVSLMDDGRVEITCHRSEMGQHARTAVAQIVADEMEADWDRIVIAQALGDKRYGDQNTDGSRSIRFNFERLRLVGASFRSMFAEAAAQGWDVSADTCRVEQHRVYHDDTGRSIDFADLVATVSGMEPPAATSLTLKDRDAWRYIGKGKATVDMQDILTGRGHFGADVRLPDTVVASIERPPVVLAKVESFDASEALKVPGVVDVVEMPALTENPVLFKPLGGVAVLATNTWAAQQARSKLKIEWSASPNQGYSSDAFREVLSAATDSASDVHTDRGDVDAALADSQRTHSARYYVPHLTQAPMEPPAATARATEDGVEVW